MTSTDIRPHLGWRNWPSELIAKFETILSTLDQPQFPGAILPVYKENTLFYYVIATNQSEWQSLISLLYSSVGATITDLSGIQKDFNNDDIFESTLIDKGFVRGVRFTSGSDGERSRYCCDALVRLSHLANRNLLPSNQPRTTAEVLHSFDVALASHNWQHANSQIEYLRTHLRLDALNLRFLEVKLLASSNQWTRISQLSYFSTLCQLKRPPEITNALVECVYWTSIESHRDKSPEEILHLFKSEILPNSDLLFTHSPATTNGYVASLFLMACLSSSPVDNGLIQKLEERADTWSIDERNLFQKFSALHTPSPTNTSIETNPLEQLMSICAGDTHSVLQARIVLQLATEINSLEGYSQAKMFCDLLEDAEINILLSNNTNRILYEEVLASQANTTSSWLELINELNNPTTDVEQLISIARRASDEWPVETQFQSTRDIELLVESISRIPKGSHSNLLAILPIMSHWLIKDPNWPNPTLENLYKVVYENVIYVMLDTWRLDAFQAAIKLLEGIFILGINAERYRRLTQDIGDIIPAGIGVNDVDSLLELAELTVNYSSSDLDARERLWGQILGVVSPLQRRLDLSQVRYINDIAHTFHMGDIYQPTEYDDTITLPSLAGKTITIYTLVESVGQRGKRILQETFPGITVELIHDKVNSRRLENLEKTSDIFVVCWSSAAHAATSSIDRVRPQNATTLYPSGSGSSSIIRIIENHLYERSSDNLDAA